MAGWMDGWMMAGGGRCGFGLAGWLDGGLTGRIGRFLFFFFSFFFLSDFCLLSTAHAHTTHTSAQGHFLSFFLEGGGEFVLFSWGGGFKLFIFSE